MLELYEHSILNNLDYVDSSIENKTKTLLTWNNVDTRFAALAQHMGTCPSWEMKLPFGGSNPHGKQTTFPHPMWGRPPRLLVIGAQTLEHSMQLSELPRS